MKPEKADHNFNRKIALIIMVVVLMITAVYFYRGQVLDINLPTSYRPSRSNESREREDYDYTRVRLTLGTGGRTGLAVTVAIPYEDRKQRSQIHQNMVRIENDFIMRVEQQRLYQLASEQKYDILRQIILNIVNSYLDKPLKEVFFEDFFILG